MSRHSGESRPSFSGDLFFLGLINELPVPAVLFRGGNFIVELANDEALKIFGRDQSCIGKTLKEIAPELSGQPFYNMLSEAFESGNLLEGKESLTYIEKSDALEPVYLTLIFKPLKDDTAKTSGVLCMAYDVSEQVLSRNRIREVEERLRLAIDSAQLGTFDMNLISGESNFSPRFREIFGFTKENITQYDIANAIHPGDLHISDKENQSILEGGFINYDVRIICGKETKWINTVGKLFLDENRNPVRLIGTVKDITAQKNSEEKLARMASLVESSNDAIISKTLDNIITSWNEAAERIYGYPAEEMIGSNIYRIIPPEYLAEEDRIMERIRKGESVEHFETRRLTKNNRIIDISLTVSPLKDLRGNIIGVSKISRDITAQKRIERHIFESEERLQMLISAGELGTWEIDVATDHTNLSQKTLEILGFKSGDAPTRQEIIKLVHPDDRPARDAAFREAPLTGSIDAEFRIIRTDRRICWVNLQGKVLYDRSDKPVKIMGTIRDITNKILAMQELRESEQKFRLLANSMPQLIWTSNNLGHLDYFNQSFELYSGMTLAEIAKGGWLQMVHAAERQESIDKWSESVRTGHPFIFEHRFRKFNGEYRWHLSRALPQTSSDGEIQMWVGTSTDIHEQKTFSQELEKKVRERTRDLEEANRDLEKMNQELASFAYVSSHDLQEPLRKIQTFAMHILEKEERSLSETGKDYFQRMQKAASRMQNLIEDLLTYSRTNTGEKVFEKTDLNALLQEVKNELDQKISDKRATILSDHLPVIHVIPYQFRQLFTNLISNSLKFSKKDVLPEIKITLTKAKSDEVQFRHPVPSKEYYKITVRDNGIGFLPEYNEKIFEVFQRLHGRSEYEGTGIGLAIAKKIVENHGGHINAFGEPGRGAEFNVYIPDN